MKKKEIIVGVLVAIVSVYAISQLVIERRFSDMKSHYDSRIASQSESLVEVAKALNIGSGGKEAELIVADCSVEDMTAYDTLLSSLDKGLAKPDLDRLAALFDVCGDVASTRRAVTALLLEREVKLLRSYMEGRSLLGNYLLEDTNLSQWESLAKKEVQISELFIKLVDSQEAIISTLQTGVAPTSINVENIRATAQKIKEEINLLSGEVSALHQELINS